MKRSIKIAVAAAVALSATSAFATNGDHLIGLGAKARGMGGIGIGMSHGAESALVNPAMITSVKGTEVSFGGTVFMPDVETNIGYGFAKSDADLSVIPEVSLAQNAGNGFSWGVGMWGTAGMGTDYRDKSTQLNMVTNLQLMQFGVPLAYKTGGLSFGIAPVLQYGSLDMNFVSGQDLSAYGGLTAGATSRTKGVSQDFGIGYNLGAAYELGDITVGASYKSAIDMEYKGQIKQALIDFGLGSFGVDDHLEQPAEIGIGASYKMGESTFAVDYKKIKWSDAKGYKDFGWDDQNVIMLGYEYATANWAARFGYNHASSAVINTSLLNGNANMLNLLGFPATVEDHYTVGGTYNFSKMTSLDLAYVYSPEETKTYGTTTTKHSQDAVSVQLNFDF